MKTWGLMLTVMCLVGCSLGSNDGDVWGGAGGGDAGESGSGYVGASGSGGDEWQAGAGDTQPTPTFEAFDLPIGQTVTVGAFVLTLGAAHVAPHTYWLDEAKVTVDFTASNNSADLTTPFAEYRYDDALLLDVGGKYFYGSTDAEPVPGLRMGEGTLEWDVDLSEVTLDALRAAVITLGYADENQVVVPLADPSATIGLNDIALDVSFTIPAVDRVAWTIESARIQYSSRSTNRLYAVGTAVLVLTGYLLGTQDLGWGVVHRSRDSVFLESPDGLATGPQYLNELVHAGERVPVDILFEIEQPISGTYTFGVYDSSEGTATHTFVVP